MMDTIQLAIPAAISVEIKYHGEQVIDLTDKSPEWFAWAVGLAIKQSTGDASAGKAKDEPEQAKKDVWEKFSRIAKGEIPKGGSGSRGSRLEPEDKADFEWLKANYDAKLKQKDLAQAWANFTAVKLVNAGKATVRDPDLAEKVAEALPDLQAKVRATKGWKAFKVVADTESGKSEADGIGL